MTDLRERLAAALAPAYQVEREIGGGGMSRVFVAVERALSRPVAIKVLGQESQAVNTERFRREILLSARLQHPHIVPVLTAGDVDGLAYFVMPFVEGVSLRTRLRDQGPLPIGEATRILRNVAAALHYAHRHGVIHRDIKPDNVMLSEGVAVVLDFGVAKAIAESTPVSDGVLTGAGFVVGTPAYMAPEQIAADPALDHRADLYALGVVGYEMFAGEPPFRGAPHDVFRKHLAEAPGAVASHRPDTPPALAALITRCLAKAPGDRPASAAEVLDVLDGVATPLPGRLPSAARKSRPERWREAIVILGAYLATAGGTVVAVAHFAAQQRIPDRLLAVAIIGAMLGLPIAIGTGLFVRVRLQDGG